MMLLTTVGQRLYDTPQLVRKLRLGTTLQKLRVENLAKLSQPMSDGPNVRGLHIGLIAEFVTFVNEFRQFLILPVDFPLHVQLSFRKTPVSFTQVASPVLYPSDRRDHDGATAAHKGHYNISIHMTLFYPTVTIMPEQKKNGLSTA